MVNKIIVVQMLFRKSEKVKWGKVENTTLLLSQAQACVSNTLLLNPCIMIENPLTRTPMTEKISNQTPLKQRLLFICLILIAFAALLWINLRFSQLTNAGSDFLTRWLPVQLMVYEGVENPYSDEVSYQIQLLRYGRAALPGEAPGLFAYPYYIVPFILPFALIKDLVIARALWMLFLQLCHITIILLSLRICRYRPTASLLLLLLMFSLISADMLIATIEGNPASLAALFIVLSLFFIQKEKDTVAGLMLALATIKPQLTVLFFILVWLWAFSNKRWKIMTSSAISVAILMGVSFIFLPQWFAEFFRQVFVYPGVAQPNTPATIFAGVLPATVATWIGRGFSLVSLLLLAYVWYRSYKQPFSVLSWSAGVTLALLPFSGIASTRTNLVVLLPFVTWLIVQLKRHPNHPQLAESILLGYILLSWVFVALTRTPLVNGIIFAYFDLLPLPLFVVIGLLVSGQFLKHPSD